MKGVPMTALNESWGRSREGKFAIHHVLSSCLECDSFKGKLHIHSFSSIFFSHNTLYSLILTDYLNEDKMIKKLQ